MKKILALCLALVMIFALCACGQTAAPAASTAPAASAAPSEAPAPAGPEYDKVTLKLSHVNAVDQPIGVAVDNFAKLVNERSGGNVTIEVYPASSLYNQEDAYDAIELGNLDMCVADVSGLSNRVPEYGLYALPFLYDSYDTMAKIVDGPVGEALEAKLEEQMGVKALGWVWNGFRNIVSNDPIKSIEDCKNYLLRSPGIDLYLDTFDRMGFTTVIIPWGDAFTGMQSGLCDAVETTTEAIYTQGFYTVGNNVTLSHHMLSIIGPIINLDVWNKLSPDTQQLIMDCWAECRAEDNKIVEAGEDEYTKLLKDAGVNIYTFEDYDKIVELFTPMWEEYATNGGYTDLLEMAISYIGS